MANELSIKLIIADRPYRLSIERSEEETIRKAGKLIEEQINCYADNYHYSDKQDLLAMVALHFATMAVRSQSETEFIQQKLEPALEELNNLLDENLKD